MAGGERRGAELARGIEQIAKLDGALHSMQGTGVSPRA